MSIKRFSLFALTLVWLLAPASCSDSLGPNPYVGQQKPPSQGGAQDTLSEGGTGNSTKEALQMTAFMYPEGYDWRRDTAKGTVDCRLLLQVDGRKILEIPVSDAEMVSSDVDMHRVIDEHVYTDYSTQDETVVKRDGHILFRFMGRECVLSMLVVGNDVFTLGEDRANGIARFRKNGNLLLELSDGQEHFGSLDRDGASVCFFFKDGDACYKAAADGGYSMLDMGADVVEVDDICLYGGRLCWIGTLASAPLERVLCMGDSVCPLELARDLRAFGCKFDRNAEGIIINGLAEGCFSGQIHAVMWKEGVRSYAYSSGLDIYKAVFTREGHAVIGHVNGMLHVSGWNAVTFPPEYQFYSYMAFTQVDRELIAGITRPGDRNAMLWRSGEWWDLGFNGFVASLETVIVPK